MLLRKLFFIAIAAFFLFNAIRSGDPPSMVIAALLAGIALYVAAGGKVHRKFSAPPPQSADEAFRTQDDRELSDFLGRVKDRVAPERKDASADEDGKD